MLCLLVNNVMSELANLPVLVVVIAVIFPPARNDHKSMATLHFAVLLVSF